MGQGKNLSALLGEFTAKAAGREEETVVWKLIKVYSAGVAARWQRYSRRLQLQIINARSVGTGTGREKIAEKARQFEVKWIGFTVVLIPLFKWLAYLERGYRAYGEELCVIGFVILLYSVVHSEPYLAWREKRRNKRRLKRLSERRVYCEKI